MSSPQLQIRSTAARILAWAWLAFAVLNLLDLAIGITGKATYTLMTATLAVLLLLGCGVAYVLGLRPAILADEAGLTVRNPLRDLRAPWGSVKEVEGREAVVVRWADATGTQRKTRAWVLQSSPRAAVKAEARARKENPNLPPAALKGRTPVTFAAQQLNEAADRHRPKARSGNPATRAEEPEDTAPATLSWNVWAVLSLAVPAALAVILAIAGTVS